jgi:DNA repair protein RecN (Recombination protein N)
LLQRLYIRDFALIEELEVDFNSGLNIVTGETGAGKSIVVGALKLMLGDRASMDVVRQGGKKAIVEGIFESPTHEAFKTVLRENGIDIQDSLILRREVSSSQSRAFINDSPATLSVLKEVASELVDLHGQHEHQSLLRTETHLDLVDGFGGLEGLVRSYEDAYREARNIGSKRDQIASRERELQQERDLLEYQISDIDSIAPGPDEEDELEAERRKLANAERLFEATSSLFDLLYNSESAIGDLLVRARNELQDLTRIDGGFEAIRAEIASAQISVSEAASFLQDYNSRIEFNPERLEEIRERLIDFDRLKRKYGGTIESVLAHRADIAERYELASDFEGVLKKLNQEFASASEQLSDVALRLSAKRRSVAAQIEAAIVKELATLGMPNSRFSVQLTRKEDPSGWVTNGGERLAAGPRGIDSGAFFVSTNPGVEPMPMTKVASGGEVSRIMLALKSILAKSERMPILIFDEIDTGISGAIAQRVGDCMLELGRYHQIIAITHLPQVAAAGETHFKVKKWTEAGETKTSMVQLSETERRVEVASLLSGSEVTEASLRSARELLESRPTTTPL